LPRFELVDDSSIDIASGLPLIERRVVALPSDQVFITASTDSFFDQRLDFKHVRVVKRRFIIAMISTVR
jgi:hypothetical protein